MINQTRAWFYRFLRKTQKYTGTDNVYLVKSGFWLTLGQAASITASFLLAIAFANLLSPTTYGNYKYIISLAGLLSIFALTGMRIAVMQAVARSLEGSFYTGFKAKLKWGLLGSLVAILGAGYYWLRGNYLLPIPLLITAVFLPLMQASQIYLAFLASKKLFNVRAKYNIVNQIICAGAIITTLFLTKNLFWLIAVYFVFHTFSNYSFYLITRLKFKPNKKEDPQTLSYGMHLSLMGVISAVANHIDKILLFTFIGSAQLAIYSFAIFIPEQIRSIIKNINVLALPKLAAKSREEIRASMIKKIWKLLFLTTGIMVLYIIVAPYIYKIFFSQYLESIPYSQLFVLSLISFPVSLLSTSFQAKAMKKELYLIKLIPLARIILLFALIPFYGILGAILATIGTRVFGLALILFLFRKF